MLINAHLTQADKGERGPAEYRKADDPPTRCEAPGSAPAKVGAQVPCLFRRQSQWSHQHLVCIRQE